MNEQVNGDGKQKKLEFCIRTKFKLRIDLEQFMSECKSQKDEEMELYLLNQHQQFIQKYKSSYHHSS